MHTGAHTWRNTEADSRIADITIDERTPGLARAQTTGVGFGHPATHDERTPNKIFLETRHILQCFNKATAHAKPSWKMR